MDGQFLSKRASKVSPFRNNIRICREDKMKQILIRADANPSIGMGHIMRCLSIADAATSAGGQVTFIIADDVVSGLIKSRGHKALVLHSDYKDMDAELKLWPTITPDLIIVDSYYVTHSYLQALQELVRREDGEDSDRGRLAYLDDLASFPYPVDILVNYNVYGPDTDYHALYADSYVPKMILGPTYAPLRAMFRGGGKKVQKKAVKDILISTGGSDELHLVLALIKSICKHKIYDHTFHFLIGAMNTDKDEIRILADGRKNITLHENVADMKPLIESMDLAVSAAGSTMYEICACGVPLVTYSLADNQIPGAEAFERLGLAVNVGDLRDEDSIMPETVINGELRADAVDKIMSAIGELSGDYKRRVDVGERMQELIDGFGADRMVKEILS